MDNVASTSSPSLMQFESFIAENPTAQNIVVSDDGRITTSSSALDQDQAKTKEAFKQALRTKYPEQDNLVDEAFSSLQALGKSWGASDIHQVIKEAEENAIDATWKDVGDEEIGGEPLSQHDLNRITAALNEYVQQITEEIEKLSPEERASLQQQVATAGLAAGGTGLAALAAAHASNPAAHVALANLLTTVSAPLSHGAPAGHLAATALPATHFAAASALIATSATAAVASTSIQVTVASAAAAIVPFIIAGAIAHRVYIAASRIQSAASSGMHELNNISTGMIAAAFATLPPAQGPLLIAAIIGGIAGQHVFDPGMFHQAFHNIRDGALAAYLIQHPEIAVMIGHEVESLLLAAGKSVLGGAAKTAIGGASTAATGLASTTAKAIAVGSIAAPSTAGVAKHVASTSLVHHSIGATAAHGVSAAATVVATTIAAHPVVAATMLLGGACAAAYQYSSTSSQTQTA